MLGILVWVWLKEIIGGVSSGNIVACLTKIWVFPKSVSLILLLLSVVGELGKMDVFFFIKFRFPFKVWFFNYLPPWNDLPVFKAKCAKSSPEELAGYILVTYFVYMFDM